MRRERDLINDNIELLAQIKGIIESLDDESFIESPARLLHSGIGSHIRHCLDFYTCFLRGVGDGLINYDQRDRDPACERDRQAALARVDRIRGALQEMDRDSGDRACLVILEGGDSPDASPSRSTIKRELQFLISHTVHHYALVAVILNWQGRETPRDFGVAPSSIAYWSNVKRENGTGER